MVPSEIPSPSQNPNPLSGKMLGFPLFGFFLVVLGLWATVCYLSRQPGPWALPVFLSISAAMVTCTVAALWYHQHRGQPIAFRWILLSALILRLVSLLGEPLFEDDYFRYLWDGFQTATTNDPYSLAPDVFFDRDVPEIFEPILSFINYPDVATVYGPFSQWLFALGYVVAPADVWPLQLMAGMADLLVLIILFKLGCGNALLLYAWSPLLLKEFSLTAHPDIYGVLGLMLSVYAVYKHRPALAGAALGFAFGSKVFAILALPYLLTRTLSIRFWVVFIAAFITCLALMTASFGTVTIWAPEGLKAMADSWLFNAPLYVLLLNFMGFQAIKILLLSLFVLYGFAVFCRRLIVFNQAEEPLVPAKHWLQSPAAFRGDWLFGFFLLCLPVLNPWYMVWLLPFAVLYPSVWAWAASWAVLLSYWYGSYIRGAFEASEQLPHSIIAIEFSVIAVLSIGAWALGFFNPKKKFF